MTAPSASRARWARGDSSAPPAPPAPAWTAFKSFLQFWKLAAWQWNADRCGRRAAGLTFETALSLVPLAAVGIAVIEASGQHQTENMLVDFISEHVIPLEGASIVGYVRDFARNIQAGALGVVGVAVVLVLSFWLFHSVETSFNEVWRTRRKRPLVRKFTVFWTLATLVPFFIALSLLQGSRLLKEFTLLRIMVPFLSAWFILTLANRLLPTADVGWRAALTAGLVSALLFEAAKYLFSLYFARVAFTNYSIIYGRLALVPMLLLWIYYSWMVVLFGAEAGYTAQHKRLVEIRYRGQLTGHAAEGWRKWVNGTVAARLVLAVATWYTAGRKAITGRQLARAFNLPEEPVVEIFRRLKDASIMMEVWGEVEGYLPARPLDQIRLHDVLTLFKDNDLDTEEQQALDDLLRRTVRAQKEALADATFAALAASELGAEADKPRSTPTIPMFLPAEVGQQPEEHGEDDAKASGGEQADGGPDHRTDKETAG